MAQQLDKYILNNYNEGKTASDMYTYQQPKKQISNDAINYLENLDSTPMKAYSPRNYDLTPTTDVENTRKAFSDVYDQVLNIYGSSTSGKAIRGDYRFAVDAAIATALGKDYSEVAKNHKYYVRAITGTDMEDEGWMKAFADNWTTYWYNRELSWKQLHFDWTQDEDTKLQLQKDMTELEQKIIKKSDYRDRNLLAKSAVASAPIVNQVVESLVLTYAGAAIGGAIAGVAGGTLSGSKAFGTIATALQQNQEFFGALKATQGIAKGAIAGRNIGILANVANTFTMETGGLSRELYNEVGENGNRMSDTSRKVWSAIGGAVNTILEYKTPDPVVGMAKLGKFPLNEAKGSVREWILAYGINRFKDANSESMEEMFQAMAGDIVKTIAKEWANEKQGTNYDIGRIEDLVNDTLQDGWESYKETFMPVLVSSFIPGTYRDLQTLSASIDNGVRAQYATRNSEKGLKEAWKYQQENTNPNVIGMDFISQDLGKVKGDYSNGKLGKINVKENPNNKSMYVGATELDVDKLHWLYNKGIKAVDVNIVEQVAPSMDKHSFSNLGKAFGGSFDSSTNILTIRNDKSLESFKKYMTDMGFDIKENGNAFSITDTDTKATFTVQLATPQTAQTVQNNVKATQTVNKSNGVITNRDFAREIRNALTANGQLETKVTDEEIDIVTNIAGMYGNDVMDHVSFISEYDTSLSDAEMMAMDNASGITSFANDASRSARIILGDNSDVSTIDHEMHHVAFNYNEKVRNDVIKAVKENNATDKGKYKLKAFLGEHKDILNRAGIKDADEAMNILERLSRKNSVQDHKVNEVMIAMWDMFSATDTKVKSAMPTGIKSILQKLQAELAKIYKNLTGKELLPGRIAEAYSKFYINQGAKQASNATQTANTSPQSSNQTIRKQQRQQEAKEFKKTEEALKSNPSNFDAEGNHLAPNGEKSNLTYRQWVQVRTPSFIKWFGDWMNDPENASAVIDDNGEPLVVKHGSQVLWDAFDMNEARQNSDIVGAFFSSADEEAETYGYGGYVRDFFINIKNPAPYEYAYEIFRENQRKDLAGAITRERLLSEGYDGVIFKEDGENDEYIVFNNTDLKSATDNNGDFSSENPNIFAQQKLTSEEQVAEKADRIDNTYTFSDFAEADVENMIDADVYVPDALLDKYNNNAKVQQEKADRSTMEVFLTDNDVRRALVDNAQLSDFLKAMKRFYGTAYNDNTEDILKKIYYYNKVQTPSQMRASFKSEYGNGNIDKLLELKVMLGTRRITKVMNGKAYTQIVVPDTGKAWGMIKDLAKSSPASDVKTITDSINTNPTMWLRAYLKASNVDYAKHFADTEVGSRDYMNAKAHLMYLSLGQPQFNLITEIRKAAHMDALSASEREAVNYYTSQITDLNKYINEALTEEYAELFRDEKHYFENERKKLYDKERVGKAEEKRIRDALKEAGSEYDGPTPETLMKGFYEEILGKQTATFEELVEGIKKADKEKLERKLEGMKREYEEKLTSRKWTYAENIKKLEDNIARLKSTIRFLKKIDDDAKADAIETLQIKNMLKEDKIKDYYETRLKEMEDKRKKIKDDLNQKLKDQRAGEAQKMKNLSQHYQMRIKKMQKSYAEYKAKKALTNAIKRRLNVDHAVYSASIDESAKWIYSLMHDKKGMTDIEYDTYAMKSGQSVDADVLMFFEDAEDIVDAQGNIIQREYAFDPKAYNFERTAIPDALLSYGFSSEALTELQGNKKFGELSVGTLKELAEAYNIAKANAKAQKSAMDAEKATRRVKIASEIYSSVLGVEGGIPKKAKDIILKELGYTETEYDIDPTIQAKVLRNFTDNISRYSDILQQEASRGTKIKGWVANTIGHIQWVADYIEKDKNGPLHNLFVTRAQEALNAYSVNKDARTTKALNDMMQAVGGQERWSEIYKTLCKSDTVNVTYNMKEDGDNFSHRDGTISYNEALGIYIYAKNAQSFGNLISGKGNNFSLETLAGINPDAVKVYLEKEIDARDQYMQDLAIYNALPPGLQRQTKMPEFKSLFFQSNTDAEIRDTYARLLNNEIQIDLPVWFRDLGDAIVKTLNGDNDENTIRMEKFAGEVLNEPFKAQANYFPKVANEAGPMNAIGETLGQQTKHVSTNAVKDRQSAFNYTLRLDPINTLFGAIEAQERMINMYQTVTDMNYIMSDKGYNVGQVIESQFGEQMKKYLDSQIASLAGNKMILSDYEKTANKLLQNVAVSKIGFNPLTSVKQFISVIPAVTNTDLSASDFMKGVALATGNEKSTIESLYNKYASDIAGGSLGYEYNLLRQRTEVTGRDSFMGKLTEKSMQWTEGADQAVKKWLFAAAYDKYTKNGMSESEAGLKAAEMIKKTQSIGDAYSLSNFERNRSPFVRAFAMFSKDQFQVWNSIVFGIGNDFRDKNYGAVAEKCLGIGLMTLSTALIAGGWIPEEDEGAFDLEEFLSDIYTNLLGYTPVFGTFFTDDGSDSLLTEPFNKVREAIEGTATLGKNVLTGDYESSDWNQVFNSVVDSIGALGLPSVQIKRGVKTFAPNGIIGTEKEFNPGWLFGSFGASTYDLLF